MKKTIKKSDVLPKKEPNQMLFSIMAAIILISVVGIIISLNGNFSKKSLSGKAIDTLSKEDINKEFKENSNLKLELSSKVNNMKISGSIKGNGEAKIYLKKDPLKFLILDLDDLKEKEDAVQESPVKPIDIQDQDQKKIDINLKYREGSGWDNDNDGKEKIDKIIDFSVEDSTFYWDSDESKLCTKWAVFPENEDSTAVCYGSAECCNFLELSPTRDRWNDIFYLSYGKYGADRNNEVVAEIAYVDYSIDEDNPYSDTISSEEANLDADFEEYIYAFEDYCKETCNNIGFDSDSFELVIELSGTELTIDSVSYDQG